MNGDLKGVELFLQPHDWERNYILDYYDYDIADFELALQTIPADRWIALGQQKFLDLFHRVATQVPAYQKFLHEYGINHLSIKTWQDFIKLPTVDKNNYLHKYPLEELCWQGTFHQQHMISASSGSSGDPFFWFRSSWQEFEASLTHELLFRKFWQIDKKKTLLIVNFSMGMYVAGVLTQNCGQRLAEKNYPLTVISPGISVTECVRIIKELGGKYEQVILAGYPPLLKDIVDTGSKAEIDWSQIDIKFLFAGEGFSENWRSHIIKAVNGKMETDSSFSLYGSADANILAQETPASIDLRRLASNNDDLAKTLFGQNERLPGFFQYNPLARYFENVEGEMVFSADSSIPLIRYNIHDSGQIIDHNEILIKSKAASLPDDIIESINNWPWPFLALQGKSDAVIYYGLLIYPENIRAGLYSEKISSYVSGRAAVAKRYDQNKNSYLEVNIELAPGIQSDFKLEKIITNELLAGLIETNLEYNRLREAMGSKVNPRIKLLPHGDKKYFNRQGK